MNDWIEVKERVPGIGQRVIAWHEGIDPQWTYRTMDGRWATCQGYIWPTHWMVINPPRKAAG